MTEFKTVAVFDRHEIASTYRALVTELQRKIDAHGLFLRSAGKIELETALQAAFFERHGRHIDDAIAEVVLRHALGSERLGPGSLPTFIRLIKAVDDCLIDASDIDRAIVDVTRVGGRVPRVTDIDSIIDRSCSMIDARLRRALTFAIERAGFCGRIVVEKSRNCLNSVELVMGATFPFGVAWKSNQRVTLKDPRIVLVDGFIESVGEINALLEQAHEQRVTLCILARGFADDVLSTLRLNHDQQRLAVFPFVVPMELESLNSLVDIAIVAGADVVSSIKGDLISTLTIDSCMRVDSVTFDHMNFTIVNPATRDSVDAHVRRLSDRIEQCTDVLSVLEPRAKRLAGGHVVIRIADDVHFTPNSQAIDHAIRTIKSSVDHGVIDASDSGSHGFDRSTDRIVSLSLERSAGFIPVASLLAAMRHARACASSIAQLGSVVTLSS